MGLKLEFERIFGSDKSVDDPLNVCENHPESRDGKSPIGRLRTLAEDDEVGLKLVAVGELDF